MGNGEGRCRVYRFCRGNRKVKCSKTLVKVGEEGYIGFGEAIKKWNTRRLCLKEREGRIYRYWRGHRNEDKISVIYSVATVKEIKSG